MGWFKELLKKTKEIALMYTGTFIVIMILNQLLFFGFCLNPICLVAAMPHVLFFTVIIGSWLNKKNNWGAGGSGNKVREINDIESQAKKEMRLRELTKDYPDLFNLPEPKVESFEVLDECNKTVNKDEQFNSLKKETIQQEKLNGGYKKHPNIKPKESNTVHSIDGQHNIHEQSKHSDTISKRINIFSTFKEASEYAKSNPGALLQRENQKWRVILKK